jgi:hypothetical protein
LSKPYACHHPAPAGLCVQSQDPALLAPRLVLVPSLHVSSWLPVTMHAASTAKEAAYTSCYSFNESSSLSSCNASWWPESPMQTYARRIRHGHPVRHSRAVSQKLSLLADGAYICAWSIRPYSSADWATSEVGSDNRHRDGSAILHSYNVCDGATPPVPLYHDDTR